MTMDDIATLEAMDCIMLTPVQAAPYLGVNPHQIRWQAEREPEKLGFPVVRIGRRTKIPRVPFISFLRGDYGSTRRLPED